MHVAYSTSAPKSPATLHAEYIDALAEADAFTGDDPTRYDELAQAVENARLAFTPLWGVYRELKTRLTKLAMSGAPFQGERARLSAETDAAYRAAWDALHNPATL